MMVQVTCKSNSSKPRALDEKLSERSYEQNFALRADRRLNHRESDAEVAANISLNRRAKVHQPIDNDVELITHATAR
jgi:predicted HicB family RNase H-like nuclease